MRYLEILNNPPKLKIKKNQQEIIFTLISCMYDNKSYIRLKKDRNDEFKISHYNKYVSFAFNNLQCEYTTYDIEWEADKQNWEEVIRMLNTGTSVITEVKSR